ncbi:Cell wall glucanase [Pleurostoma richardsiae]|uniref:Cell wall glucanase n=1 Tax=Pleurostoma richardsiae TaxID=41990 RepID=A0AA38RU65_9PEZI|nr:Cell wall glucanase [Pleurostoma richardsiae]
MDMIMRAALTGSGPGNGLHRRLHASALISTAGERVTIVDVDMSVATEIPEIIVFVDPNGTPVSTSQAVAVLVPAESTSAPTGLSTPALRSIGTLGDLVHTPSVPTHPPADGVAVVAAAAAAGSNLPGIAYAPYNSDGSCKSANQVVADFRVLAPDFALVRVYGVDCDQVPKVLAAAADTSMRVMLGIFSLDNLGDEVAILSKAVGGDWSLVDTVSVGNELVNNGQASPTQVINALNAARQMLRQAGWQGPVVTVDTFVAHLAHPELCQASDYCAANIHPFFDPNTAAPQAGVFVSNMMARMRQNMGNTPQRIVVTESGWPWQGNSNGQAVPGMDHQQDAVSSIRASFASSPRDLILFSAFNDAWKKAEAGTFYAEQFWGINGANAPQI